MADAFPPSPGGYGWANLQGKLQSCPSEHDLLAAIQSDDQGTVVLVWTPRHTHMILPEELTSAVAAVASARERRTADNLAYFKNRILGAGLLFLALAIWIASAAYRDAPSVARTPFERLEFALRALVSSHILGIALLLFLIFVFIPWYQARKAWQEIRRPSIPLTDYHLLLRFETWLELQRAPFTRILFLLISLVGLVQLLPGNASETGGLLRAGIRQGEWWRLFTSPFLHGNPVHFAMNAAALLYLGKRVEVFARWPHVPMVFLFSALVGGDLSLRFSHAPNSLGASGGLMGWLGFLLVFESLHPRLVPRSARRRLLAGVFLTALIGFVGYRYIDNAAHIGGLLAGMLYALVVFPTSKSARRPKNTVTDLIAGSLASFAIIAGVIFTITKIFPR